MAVKQEGQGGANLFEYLLKNQEQPINILIVDDEFHEVTSDDVEISCQYRFSLLPPDEISWCKSLESMPSFTIKEIEEHRKKSGKTPDSAIIKTLNRGRQFKNERYISADTIFTKWDSNLFTVRAQCRASMKKEKRDIRVNIDINSGKVVDGNCSCPAGQSGYCNHVMALLLELADYSLNEFQTVPEEIACTSRLRQWGVPGESLYKAPVMQTTVQKQTTKKGISSTLYDPRLLKFKEVDWEKIAVCKERMAANNTKSTFLTCASNVPLGKINTPYGMFDVGSPLSFHLNPVDFTTKIVTNIDHIDTPLYTEHDFLNLPFRFINKKNPVIPRHWQLSSDEWSYFDSIRVTKESCQALEYDTIENQDFLREFSKKDKIATINAHRIFIRKKNFQSLADTFLNPKPKNEMTSATKEALKHTNMYKPIALEQYSNIVQYTLNRDIAIRETGIIIQPNLFWLVASPVGLISDRSNECSNVIGLVEIKCPKTKKNHKLNQLLNDPSFYIKREEGKIMLDRSHPDGHFAQIQMDMGLSGATFCDFVVFTFDGIIVARTHFDEDYFISLVKKINSFYKEHMLPKILKDFTATKE